MTRLAHALALFSFLLVAARDISPRSLNAKRLEAIERWKPVARGRNYASNTRRDTDNPASVKNITFSNPEASSEYAWVYAYPVSSLIPFQSSMSMARPFLSSTLMLVRPGRA
jgi:hypothetical protein